MAHPTVSEAQGLGPLGMLRVEGFLRGFGV